MYVFHCDQNEYSCFLQTAVFLSGFQICDATEDMISGGALNIPDSSLTSSGYHRTAECPDNNDYSPRRARLHSVLSGAYCIDLKIPSCCMRNPGSPVWIQADLGKYMPPQGAHLTECNRTSTWHLPRNPKLVWHPARLIKEGGCVDLSMDHHASKRSLGPLWIRRLCSCPPSFSSFT